MERIVEASDRSRKIVILAISLVIGLYVHWLIGDAIAKSLIYIWYIFLIIAGLIGIAIILYGFRIMATKWQIQVSLAQSAIAESRKASRDIRTFARDEQVYQFDIDPDEIGRKLDLIVTPEFNGALQKPSDQEVAIFNLVNQTFNQQINNYGNEGNEQIYDGVPLLESGMINNDTSWIDSQMLTAPHIHLCGPTTSGKTTLGKYIIEKMQSASNGSEFWLINPKHVAYKDQWPLKPFVDNIDDVLGGLQKLAMMLKDRIADKDYDPATYKNVVIVIDEWDWIYEHHRNSAVSALRQLIKVGAELNYKILLLGQSPLSQDTGLSGSDYHNMARVAIWAAADKLINGLPMSAKEKAPIKAQVAELKRHPDNIRYALVVLLNEQPAIRIIPNLEVSNLIIEQPELIIGLTEDQQELAIVEALKDGASIREAAKILIGDSGKVHNGSISNKVVQIAQKHGLEL